MNLAVGVAVVCVGLVLSAVAVEWVLRRRNRLSARERLEKLVKTDTGNRE